MQPLVGKYLSSCFSGLKDRNNTVRKYNASAIGHLIGVAKVCSLFSICRKTCFSFLIHKKKKIFFYCQTGSIGDSTLY